ncbi:MAG: four helix bundle protein [Gemmatimonadota bacterium]|nr:four helix bundle protein [Gemmatimonadota bacterium]
MPTAQPPEPPYERLDAWRACHELALVIHRSTRNWPLPDGDCLIDRVRSASCRAAVSLMECAARAGARERGRCVVQALGAIAEVTYLILLARDVAIIDADEWHLLNGLATRAGQLTGGLNRALKNKRPGLPAPLAAPRPR